MKNHSQRGESSPVILVVLAILLVVLLIGGMKSCTVIDPGTSGVQVTFGSVNETALKEGFHIINPFSSVTEFDVRQQVQTENDVTAPSRDQLTSTFDVSVTFSINPELTPSILKKIGTTERVKDVVLLPKLRSAIRESTKTVKSAEEYMTNEMQTTLQNFITTELKQLEPQGIIIHEVLLRDIKLPAVIANAVIQKKEREQSAIKQEAELQRFTVEQQQKVAQATAEKAAAEQAALRMRIEADAEAYKIKTLNEAAAKSPVYVQLKSLETLNEMSKNPAHKLFFIDNKGQYPVPLLHMNDTNNLSK